VPPSARGACLLVRPHPAPPRPSRGRGPANTCHTHLGIASKGRHYSGSRPSRALRTSRECPAIERVIPTGVCQPELRL
jgi:hypothetical protein